MSLYKRKEKVHWFFKFLQNTKPLKVTKYRGSNTTVFCFCYENYIDKNKNYYYNYIKEKIITKPKFY